MAVWIPVMVVPTSLATVAIAVFITVVSRAITNWPEARVNSTIPVPTAFAVESLTLYGLLILRLGTRAGQVRRDPCGRRGERGREDEPNRTEEAAPGDGDYQDRERMDAQGRTEGDGLHELLE